MSSSLNRRSVRQRSSWPRKNQITNVSGGLFNYFSITWFDFEHFRAWLYSWMYTVFYRVNCLFMVLSDPIRVRFREKISYNSVRDLFERFQIEKNPKFNSIRTLLSQSDRFFSYNDLSKRPCLFILSLEPSTTEGQGESIWCCPCKTYRF